jgi:hypothetical protein
VERLLLRIQCKLETLFQSILETRERTPQEEQQQVAVHVGKIQTHMRITMVVLEEILEAWVDPVVVEVAVQHPS